MMRGQVCIDSICGQKQSFISYIRGGGFFLENGWYCSHRCLLRALNTLVRRSLELPTPEILIHRRGRIGAILIQKGIISRDQLQLALERQRVEGGLIGEWLLKLTYLTEAELMEALSEQQGVPWLAKAGPNLSKSVMGLLPKKLCLDYKIFPFELNQEEDSLRIAAKSPIDGLLLHMLRTMLGYEIQFFIVSDSVFDEIVAAHLDERSEDTSEEIGCSRSAGAISQLILEKMSEYGLSNLDLHYFSSIFWIRFTQGRRLRDLFISIPASDDKGRDKFAGLDRQFLPSSSSRKPVLADKPGSSFGM